MPSISSKADGEVEVPEEIYVSLVTSLFSDPKTLLRGASGTIVAAAITAFKTQSLIFAACVAALTVITAVRALEMRSFQQSSQRELSKDTARAWEIRYVIGSSAYVLAMGVWSFLGFAITDDPVVQLIGVALVLVNIVGVAARNFGSKLLVSTQLACAGLPLFAGLFWTQDVYYVLAGLALAPFFFSFSVIADRLRRTLTEAVVAERSVRMLANQLDAALNNMSHGLCMVNARGVVAISNERLPQLLGLRKELFSAGRSVAQALRQCVRAGVVSRRDILQSTREFRAGLKAPGGASLLVPIKSQQTLMLTSRTMPDGGAVILAEDVTEQQNAEARIRHLAHFDSLTDLPNRVMFRNEVSRLLEQARGRSGCAVLFVDLDQFKQVNDTLGHSFGDELLKLVADRLRMLGIDARLIARLGGDEFVIVLFPIADREQASAVAERIVRRLGQPFNLDDHTVIIGASVGIALSPRDGNDAATLIKSADLALYRAKAEGRGRYCFFEPEMDARMRERRALELDLRQALERQELELEYQPMINLRSGRIASCEALLRWRHPQRGSVPPSQFIPVAEETGLIVEIGRWVLEAACREAAGWTGSTRVSVNLSPIQFRQAGLVETIEEALRRSGLCPSRLEIEITESTLLRDSEAVLAVLHCVRDMGVSIALDDFGTGYSSLSYLHNFPLQCVKIDRSFLVGIETNAKQKTLLRGIARLCGELGVRVVIEGVETTEHLEIILNNPEIEEAQGYFFARPSSASHVRGLLSFRFGEAKKAQTWARQAL
jgi:diguanylate cyclase (GGDEF)-like protein